MTKLFFYLAALIFLFQACNIQRDPGIELVFTELETNTKASLRGLFVVNEKVIWASGSQGSVLLSKDGGESWKINRIAGEEENDFRSIYAWDDTKAMVFGVAGPQFGYFTESGGESWEVVFQDTTKGLFFNSLKFADDNIGLAVSDPIDGKFFVLRTENGGRNWERVEDIPGVIDGEANFAASNTCIEFLSSGEAWIASGGLAARVFYSTDFGITWSVSKTPMIRGQASSGIFSISFINQMQGVIVGGIYDQPEVNNNIAAYTVDGGLTWDSSVTMPKEYRSCVQNVWDGKSNYFFAIGKTGCDITMDNGINWKSISDKGFYSFRSVPGKLKGFVSGNNGKIARLSFSTNK